MSNTVPFRKREAERVLDASSGSLSVRLAESAAEISASQSLRYQVFYEEMSAKPTPEMAARRLGFEVCVQTYVGTIDVVSDISLWKNGLPAGRAEFDRQGRMLRLSLKDRFFYDTPVFVRDFAENVFKAHGVKPLETADDVCFQDVTCFRGISKYGEQFLIMRFGTEAELYVRPLNNPKD